MRFRAEALVVLEGMDRAGKTTQRERLRAEDWSVAPEITHMPSGLVPSTGAVYRALEAGRFRSPLATQLLHLACHAENIGPLREARRERGLVLDRWWWSTIAYGWFGGLDRAVTREDFFGSVEMVWRGFDADLIFLFLSSFKEDAHNSPEIEQGYRRLAEDSPSHVVNVPRGDAAGVTQFMIRTLRENGIVIDD